MIRLFVGLELSADQRAALQDVRSGVENARWQRDDQLHLTLAFIGEASRGLMQEIESALARIRFDPFDLTLKGVGQFGKTGKPKALWVGAENPEPLMHLHEKILRALESAEVETDRRRYKPHVTLARFTRGHPGRIGDWLSTNERLTTPGAHISHFTLYSSHLVQDGAHYRVEARFGPMGQLDADFTDDGESACP